MDFSAPEITAVSKPKRNPLRLTTSDQKNTYLFSIWQSVKVRQSRPGVMQTPFVFVSISFKKVFGKTQSTNVWSSYICVIESADGADAVFDFVPVFSKKREGTADKYPGK